MKIQPLFSEDMIPIHIIQEHEYYTKKPLMHSKERSTYNMLCTLIDKPYIVIPQVSLGTILKVKNEYYKPRSEFWRHMNKINKKIIDYVIFDKKFFRPLIAIEYDGITHTYEYRKRRDEFVDDILNNNGIKCVHLKHNDTTSLQKTREAIIECLQYDQQLQNYPRHINNIQNHHTLHTTKVM